MITDIKKFSWAEMTSNDTGKTSASGTAGIFVTIVAGICFAFGCFTKNNEVITQSSLVIGMGSALLMGRKIRETRETKTTGTETITDDKTDAITDDLGH